MKKVGSNPYLGYFIVDVFNQIVPNSWRFIKWLRWNIPEMKIKLIIITIIDNESSGSLEFVTDEPFVIFGRDFVSFMMVPLC